MASQLVLDELKKLQTELERMQPALRQIELAEQVIEQARQIPATYLKFTALMEDQEAAFKEKLTTELNQRADVLHREVDAVVQSANGIVHKLNEHDKELTTIKGTIAPLADQLAAIKLNDRLTTLQETSSTTAGQLVQQSETLQEQLNQLKTSAATLDEKLNQLLANDQRTQWQTYVTWLLVVAGAAAAILLK